MTSSADRINLGELTSQLANAEARVCEWASAAGKRADAARLEHGRRIAALRETVSRLEAKRDDIARRTGELRTLLSDQAELERRALLEARSAEEEAEASAPLVSEAERELAEAEKALANARAVLEEASGGRQRRTAALRAALALYERTLGLRFVMPQAAEEEEEEEEEKEGNDVEGQQQQQKQQRSSDSREELKVVFTQVDARDPDRECSLGLHLSSSSSSAESGGSRASYSVLRCEPAACLGAVRRLCAVLNSSPDDFAWFVREVRAEFKARVAEEAAGGGGGV